jgi:hypothetical protein
MMAVIHFCVLLCDITLYYSTRAIYVSVFRCSFGSGFCVYEFQLVSIHELLYHPSHRLIHLCFQSGRLARFSEPSD